MRSFFSLTNLLHSTPVNLTSRKTSSTQIAALQSNSGEWSWSINSKHQRSSRFLQVFKVFEGFQWVSRVFYVFKGFLCFQGFSRVFKFFILFFKGFFHNLLSWLFVKLHFILAVLCQVLKHTIKCKIWSKIIFIILPLNDKVKFGQYKEFAEKLMETINLNKFFHCCSKRDS